MFGRRHSFDEGTGMMGNGGRRAGRWVAAAVAAVGLFGSAVFGQPPRLPEQPFDPLAEARVRQRIADQKITATVQTALRDAELQGRTNPARATQILLAAQNDVTNAAGVSSETRRLLAGQLQARTKGMQGRPPVGNAAIRPVGTPAELQAANRAALDKYADEVKTVRTGLELAAYYRDKSDHKSAERVVAGLTRDYPNNPAVIYLHRRDNFGAALSESTALAKLQGERMVSVMNEAQRSGIPIAGEVEFPADWKGKSDRRKKAMEIPLSPKEKSIIESLNATLSVSFGNRPLQEALQDLSTRMNQDILVDPRSLTDLGIDLTKPVTLDAKGISTRTALRQILGAAGLTFVVRDETIQVVTAERARDMLVTRVYYLGDIVQGVGPFGGALRWGAAIDHQQTVANVDMIINSIQSSIDPLSWKSSASGPGTITFHYPSMSIIVRASTEVHASLGSKLGGSR